MPRDYTNVEVRQILVGLGYLTTSALPGVFPFTTDDSPLTDSVTSKAIRSFQEQYKGPKLVVDGIYGNQTKAKLQEVMKILQDQLNIVVQAGIIADQPFYGSQTFNAVKAFQSKTNVKNINGIASYDLRIVLNKAATDQLQPIKLTNIGKPNYDPQKFPHQDQALNWLQTQLTAADYPGVLSEFARQFRNQTTADNQPIKLTDVAAYLDGKKFPHQDKALNWLQTKLTSDDLSSFSKRWRNL